jgi:hypothetical protein
VLGVAVTTLLLVVILKGQFHWPSHPGPAGPEQPGNEAPWGQIEYTSFNLERPDEERLLAQPLPPTQWLFDGYTETALEKFLSGPDLTREQARELTNKTRWMAAGNGWRVMPTVDVLLDLSPPARQRIYGVLQRNPRNVNYYLPVYVATARFEQWLDETGLPEDKQELIRKLAYPRGEAMCLSDFQAVQARCTPEQAKLFGQAVTRETTLLMKLRVTPDSDLEALERYWGRGGRMKAMGPLLRSLAHVPGGATVSVSFFFPEFARMRLYTCPDPETDPTALRQDCFWTSMNFMKEEPDNRYLVAGSARHGLMDDFTEVKNNWAFGDLVVLTGEAGKPVHMCVYVADNVVFTKNGADPHRPWVLMKLPEMLLRYNAQTTVKLLVLRRNGT